MSNSLISVIIPVYNAEEYLNKCVESVVNQTHKNLEIILIDDGSPDNCPAMCDEWAERDGRIKVIHKENGGVSSAKNAGLDIAHGDYIGFVDSDDWIEMDFFEILLGNILLKKSDVSICSFQTNEEERGESNLRCVTQKNAMQFICMGDHKYGILCNKLYRKDIIGSIRLPQLVCCEDLLFNFYVFKNAQKISECDLKLYHYFQNENSTVHGKFGAGAFDAVKSKEVMLSDVKGSYLEEYALWGLISSCFVVLSGVIQSGKCKDRYNYLRKYIVDNRKTIYKSKLYSKTDKIKTLILTLSKGIYNILIKRKHS